MPGAKREQRCWWAFGASDGCSQCERHRVFVQPKPNQSTSAYSSPIQLRDAAVYEQLVSFSISAITLCSLGLAGVLHAQMLIW
jgi:hypothetical protein